MVLTAENISKTFNRRTVFREIGFTVAAGQSIAVTGRNGAGKSTLLKILAGLLTPTSGSVRYAFSGSVHGPEDIRAHLGFVSPYLQLYDEFSALENLRLLSRMRSATVASDERCREMLTRFGLWDRCNDQVRTYSSGMKQRLKYVVALLHDPEVLMLDEPGANLDADGIAAVAQIYESSQRRILIVATNDRSEAERCELKIHPGTGVS